MTVNKLICLPQLSGGKFLCVKLAIAEGAIKTDIPNMMAEKIRLTLLGNNIGKADPTAMHTKTQASGNPESYLAKIWRQTNGETVMHIPNKTHSTAINTGEAEVCFIHADKNVRYTM